MTKHIPIFFTFDNNYAVPACVAFYSLLNKAKSDIFYDMYVIHSDITDESKDMINNVVNKFDNASLNFMVVDDFIKKLWADGNFENHQSKQQFTVDTIIPCFAASLFPEHDKIIYSDVDVVFNDDISEIFDIDIDKNYLASVRSAFLKYNPAELDHLPIKYNSKLKDTYFAGGIWVLNLKKIREDNLENKMIEIIKDDNIVKRWPDQDIMNIACDNNVKYLPLNYIGYPYLDELLQKTEFESHYSRDELYNSIINPKIIHYAAVKPWKSEVNYSENWWTIFNYLKLPRTKIFEPITNRFIKKYNKYKKITTILAITQVLTLLLLIFG